MELSGEDIRILASVMNWRMNLPEGRSSDIALSRKEEVALRTLIEELGNQRRYCLLQAQSISVKIDEPYASRNGGMQLPQYYWQLLISCLRCFLNMPPRGREELEAIVGSSLDTVQGLLTRMIQKKIQRVMDKSDKAESFAVFEPAMEEFFAMGQCTHCCNRCGGIIKFWSLNDSAWQHSCPCGRFNGTLRGL